MHIARCLPIFALSAALSVGSVAAQVPPEGVSAPRASAHRGTDDQPVEPALSGRWRLAETADEEQERLRAVDRAIQRFPSLVQSRARARLVERTSPPPALEIEIEGTRLLLSGDSRVELDLGGPPVEVSGERGKARMSARMEQDSLEIKAQGGRGGRTTTYDADGDRLTVRTHLRGERLPEAVSYTTTYARSR